MAETALKSRNRDLSSIMADILTTLRRGPEELDDAAVESVHKRFLALAERVFGPEHPQVADFLANLAGLKIAIVHPVAALALLRRALLIDEHTLDNVFPFASKKSAFLWTMGYRFDMLLNLVVQKLPIEPDAVRAAMDAVLQWKGGVLDALARERKALPTSDEPLAARTAQRLQIAASRLASLIWAGPGDLPIDEYRGQLAALEVEKEQLEEDLAGRSEIYSAALRSRKATLSVWRGPSTRAVSW